MASACVNNSIGVSPATDFEFRLDKHVTMLPADELFFDGKLKPLESTTSFDMPKFRRKIDGEDLSLSADPFLFSPKAPRCSSRWRELFGLRKKVEKSKTTSSSSSSSSNTAKSIRLLLHRNPKTTTSNSSSSESSLNIPLLKDNNNNNSTKCIDSSSSSSRLSLSSTSSSSHDFEDLPRLSLDNDKPTRSSNPNPNATKIRMRHVSCRTGSSPVKRANQDPTTMTRGLSVNSPRMNGAGKVVFQGLERSSSSPSSFNGNSRPRYNRGMERSYSANVVRVTPVLNVPVCSSLRGSGGFGFGQLFSSSSSSSSSSQLQRKEGTSNRHSNGRTRRDST